MAVGLSGLLAWCAGNVLGTAFVAGDGPGVLYTADRCAQYRELAPAATDCASAAVAHHFDEVVGVRLDAGVLGVLVLLGWLVVVRPWRRRAGASPPYAVLPTGFAPTVGAALFGAAAAFTLPGGVLELAFTGRDAGAGALLSAGVVATLAFLGSGAVLWRALTTRPA